MSEKNPFNGQPGGSGELLQPMGVLEQLNLPPNLIKFIRNNRRAVIATTVSVVLVVVVTSLYGSYVEYRREKAAAAFSKAVQAEGDEKKQLLDQVIADYSSTSLALWSKVELAEAAVADGKIDEALERFGQVNNEVSVTSPLKPLVLSKLAAMCENNDKADQALEYYTQLTGYKKFEAEARKAMGLIYESKGQVAQAVEMYEKYLALEVGSQGESPMVNDRERQIVQARLSSLKK